MEVLAVTPPRRNRCSRCRQEGHNRTICPHDEATATQLRVAFNRERRAANQRLSTQVVTAPPVVANAEWQARIRAQVADMQRRLSELQSPLARLPPPNIPTVRERKIQEIIFDNAEKLPDGLYKELMDALVIPG
jgi:hypothetical protein